MKEPLAKRAGGGARTRCPSTTGPSANGRYDVPATRMEAATRADAFAARRHASCAGKVSPPHPRVAAMAVAVACSSASECTASPGDTARAER